MTFAEFRDYITVHLWKMGDQIVLDNLVHLIKMAEAELDRDLKVEDRVTVVDINVTTNHFDLPTDCKVIRALWSASRGHMQYLTPSQYADQKVRGSFGLKDYTVANKQVRLTGVAATGGNEDFECWYYRKVPSLEQEDASWVLEDYFDLYTYTVLKHATPFLREDERLATWGALQSDAMLSVLTENDHERKFAGSPLNIKFGRR